MKTTYSKKRRRPNSKSEGDLTQKVKTTLPKQGGHFHQINCNPALANLTYTLESLCHIRFLADVTYTLSVFFYKTKTYFCHICFLADLPSPIPPTRILINTEMGLTYLHFAG